ncbi:MAG: restriction endonuclease subunit S domain-containing protein, partial [Acidobacteriaceae bacterium]
VAVSANQQINILVPDARKVDPMFLTLAISANRDQVRLTASAATLPILDQEKTGMIRLAVPEIEVQIKLRCELVAMRKRTNKLLGHISKNILLLREYRASLISAAVTGQLDIDNFGRSGA